MFNLIVSGVARTASVCEKIVKYMAMTVLVVLLCAIFFQVARRIITGNSYTELEEFSIITAAWLGFFTLSYAVRKKVHVRIDLFAAKLPFLPQTTLNLLITGVTLYASLDLVRYGWLLTQKKIHVPLAILPINAGWWYLAFPVGMAFTSFFLLEQFLRYIQDIREYRQSSSGEGQI